MVSGGVSLREISQCFISDLTAEFEVRREDFQDSRFIYHYSKRVLEPSLEIFGLIKFKVIETCDNWAKIALDEADFTNPIESGCIDDIQVADFVSVYSRKELENLVNLYYNFPIIPPNFIVIRNN